MHGGGEGLNVNIMRRFTFQDLLPGKHFAQHRWSALVRVMTCRVFDAKPLTEPTGIDIGMSIDIDIYIDTSTIFDARHQW